MQVNRRSIDALSCAVCVAAAVLLVGLVSLCAQQMDYVVGPKDVLLITVWDQPDLTGKWTVEADGSFTFPFIGRVKAGGLTLKQIETNLKKRLGDGYFKDPQVSVAIEQYVSQRVFVVGEVRQAGPQPLTGDMTLIEALSRAGSTLPTASTEVVITHAPKGQVATHETLPTDGDGGDSVRVDLKALQESGQAQNIVLRDGDTIYVPKAQLIYVTGQVKNPGAYPMQTQDMTVLQAVALAGGVTDRGAQNRIRIQRVVDGKQLQVKVKALTDVVKPGDTIIVPERFF